MTSSSTASEIMAMQKHAMKILRNASDDVRITLENDMNDMAKHLQEEIDRELVWKIMVEVSGWTRVILKTPPYLTMGYWSEVTGWLVENFGVPAQGEVDGIYRVHSSTDDMEILFKNEQDAIMTILRWK